YGRLDLDPREYRILSWRWRVEGVLARSDPLRKSGDDFVARVYVAYRYDPASATVWQRALYAAYRLIYGQYPPAPLLFSVWGSRVPVGPVVEAAYTDRARIVVARSGAAEAGRWVTESHDIYADFRRIIGHESTRTAGVALM